MPAPDPAPVVPVSRASRVPDVILEALAMSAEPGDLARSYGLTRFGDLAAEVLALRAWVRDMVTRDRVVEVIDDRTWNTGRRLLPENHA